MYKYHEKLCIGKLSDPKPKEDVPMLAFKGSMGDGIPYGDANSVQGMMSPYYKDYHFKLREAVR